VEEVVEQVRPRGVVLAPSPLVTVAIEARPDGGAEIHLHPGGQGVWIARMMATLGLNVGVYGPLGGENGSVLDALITREGVELTAVPIAGENGGFVHDRRGGERVEIAAVDPPVLDRHELDSLCNLVLVHGLDADVVVMGGPDVPHVLPPDVYRRLVADLVRAGRPVVADLAGRYLAEAVAGGVTVAKASHEDLMKGGFARSAEPAELIRTIEQLAQQGAANVVVSRAEHPALALAGGRLVEICAPTFQRVDHRGAGDSMTGGIAAALARGFGIDDALRLGAAAGALNATRHGLATGERGLIERLAERVTIRESATIRGTEQECER
jgi:1-phosphofructokinase